MITPVDSKQWQIGLIGYGEVGRILAEDLRTQDILIPNGEGKLTVIHEDSPDRYRLVANVPTQFGARTIEIDPSDSRVFSVTADLTPDPGKHPPYKMAPGSFRLLVIGR